MSNPANPSMNQIKVEPNLNDLLAIVKKDILLSTYCHHVGTVKDFNPTEQTVTVELAYQQTYYKPNIDTGGFDATLVKYPILLDCPVVFLGGASAAFTFPVNTGDDCLLLFNDRDIDRWYDGQANMAPATLRLHSVSDGFALVGIRNKISKLANFDNTRVTMRYGDVRVAISSSKVQIKNGGENLKDIMVKLNDTLKDVLTAIQAITVTTAGTPSGFPNNSASFTTLSSDIQAITTRIQGLLE